MPIYEWRCADNGHLFEVLRSVGAANRKQSCPSCGAKSERVISTFAIRGAPENPTSAERAVLSATDVTKLKLPNYARLCGMDDYSATRIAAHKAGRGAEFDDKVATRALKRTARGESASKLAADSREKPSHTHAHAHSHAVKSPTK